MGPTFAPLNEMCWGVVPACGATSGGIEIAVGDLGLRLCAFAEARFFSP